MTESALMVALATVLSMIQIVNLPMGGSVTAFSMLPICIISYRYNVKWGLFTAAVYGLFQMMLGMNNLRYATSIWVLIAIILFDYVIAFAVLGLGGMFRGKFKNNQAVELSVGIFIPCLLRYLCHFISGWTVWGVWAPEGMPAWQYSLAYNATYMIPETIATFVGAVLISVYLDFSGRDITRRSRKAAASTNNVAYTTKLAGICIITVGVLWCLFDAVNVLFSESGELDTNAFLIKLGVSLVIGIVLCALGEIVRLLAKRVESKDNGDALAENELNNVKETAEE